MLPLMSYIYMLYTTSNPLSRGLHLTNHHLPLNFVSIQRLQQRLKFYSDDQRNQGC